MEGFIIFLLCCATFFSGLMGSTAAVDTITANQSIRDGDTIVSASGSFELGFFRPGSSSNRYLGIWYKASAEAVVWVANRDTPLTNRSGVLRFDGHGNLLLVNSSERKIWSTNSTGSATNPVAQLLDDGNLVLRDGSDPNLLWQSFDYPGDTFLPGMKLGRDLVTGLDWHLSCWQSADDPSPGDYTMELDLNGYPQTLVKEGSVVKFRSGPWNGIGFNGMPNLMHNRIYRIEFVRNEKEIYYKNVLINRPVLTRAVLISSGELQRFTWIDHDNEWSHYSTAQFDACEEYTRCGAYGSCNVKNSPQCECLRGFKPKFQEEWDAGDWSNGCVRMTELNCGNGDGFRRYSGVKLPDTRQSWFNESMNLRECRSLGLRNCSCTAYANTDIREGGSGCLLWFDELIDIRDFSEDIQHLYVRMAASELETSRSSYVRKLGTTIAASILAVLGILLLLHLLIRRKLKRGAIRLNQEREYGGKDLELPVFGFGEIANATNNFSIDNKLGEGGFGPVYKGVLGGGKEIAVKRLSKDSSQGLDEFKNEVLCIAKLQHRNLVKLLGCCIEAEERMLIYEYMPNKSVDSFIFDKELGNNATTSSKGLLEAFSIFIRILDSELSIEISRLVMFY